MENLNQLKCPSCGAVLSLSIPDQIVVECPYCHQQVINTNAYRSSKQGEEPRILEFKLEVKDVINLLVNDLINNERVPKDIFDKMSISSTKQYYVPMYIFEGTYRAPWSAKIPRDIKKQRINYQGKLEDYYETVYDYPNGEVAGNFIFNFIPNKELTRLKLENYDISYINISPTSLPPFSQVNIGKDIVLIAPSEDADYVWRERGYDAVQNQATSEAEHQARGYLTNCSTSCELKKSWMVYIPIWIIEYKYNGENYTYIYYAEKVVSVSKPCDNEFVNTNITSINAQPTTEQQKIIDNYNKRNGFLSNIRNYGCLSTALIGPIGCGIIQEYKLFDDKSGGYGDGFNMYFFFIGLSLVIIMSVIKFFYRLKNGIDDIEKDIAYRTKILQKEAEDKMNKILLEAENYKRDTGKRFLNNYLDSQELSVFDSSIATAYANPASSFDANPPKTKTCVRCSKQIDVNHVYCRYCGAKQN